MITHIIIHVLPTEIDRFETQMFQLRRNGTFISKEDEVIIDATLNTNNIDWRKSKIKKQYFVDRFEKIKTLCEWATTYFDINDDNTCLGVSDKRRLSIQKYSTFCDNFIFLDTDLWFPDITLKQMIDAVKGIKNQYYIISPQIIKMWDKSWDILCNNAYKDITNINYFEVFTKKYEPIEVISLNAFKMAGGWFNMISSNLALLANIPISFSPYGMDDTFIIECCNVMKDFNIDVKQYLMKNLVVTECFGYDNRTIYSSYISFNVKDQGKLFRKNDEKLFWSEIENFGSKLIGQPIRRYPFNWGLA